MTGMHQLRFLTVREAADALRVSKMTVYRTIEAGHLRAVRVGRSIRIPVSALNEYVGAQTLNPWTES